MIGLAKPLVITHRKTYQDDLYIAVIYHVKSWIEVWPGLEVCSGLEVWSGLAVRSSLGVRSSLEVWSGLEVIWFRSLIWFGSLIWFDLCKLWIKYCFSLNQNKTSQTIPQKSLRSDWNAKVKIKVVFSCTTIFHFFHSFSSHSLSPSYFLTKILRLFSFASVLSFTHLFFQWRPGLDVNFSLWLVFCHKEKKKRKR